MIAPVCDSCGKELDEFGGLIFGPPDPQGTVVKFHVCQKCFKTLKDEVLKHRSLKN